jgi:hypothetical protein
MMTGPGDEQVERAQVMKDEARMRERASTMFEHAKSAAADELGGRFGNAQGKQHVVGATPGPAYPRLPGSSPWHGPDPVGQEPPLGYSIDAMPEPAGVLVSPAAPGDPAHAPSSSSSPPSPYGDLMSERAGSSLSSEEQTNE